MRVWLVILALALLVLAPAALPSHQSEGELTLVRIEGELDVGTQALLERALGEARARHGRLIVELETPGGEIELMWRLANALLDASSDGVGTIAWVHDRALSAGSLLALACERVYMRSHATIGSALPVQVGPGGLVPVSEDKEVREKLSSALRGEFRGVAEKRGRSGLLAEAMVDPEVEVLEIREQGALRLVSAQELDDLRARVGPDGTPPEFVRTVVERGELFNATGSEAVALGLADGLAESLEELVSKLGQADAVPHAVVRTRSEDLAGWLNRLGPLFLIAAFVLGYIELKTPGFGVAGILAAICFGVWLFGRYLVGLADIPQVLLITAGGALVAAEIFLAPGTIWLGLLGAVAILGGLVWSFAGSRFGLEYGLDRAILVEEAFRVVSAGFVALLLIWGLSRLLPHTPFFSRMVLATPESASGGAMPETGGARARVAHVGAEGRALTALRPVGKVVLEGEPGLDFEARAEGAEIGIGARVRVVEVQPSGRLVVAVLGERSTLQA
jgi:membrane-bound serine protease (ClpP class)